MNIWLYYLVTLSGKTLFVEYRMQFVFCLLFALHQREKNEMLSLLDGSY